MAKRFLASVANVELFTREGGELKHFASAHTLTDSSIGFQISMEDVRGGQGAKLFGRFGHTTGMTLQMTDAMFDINYLRLNLGAKRSESNVTSVLVEGEQQVVPASGGIQLQEEAVSIGHLCGLEDVMCWAHKVSCSEGTSSDKTLTVSGTPKKTISQDELEAAGFVEGDIITISYFKNDPSAILFDVSATFFPGEVMAVMTAQEYAGDSANVTTGEAVGQLVVKIPRLQLDGQFDLGLNMTSAATISLNGSALATLDPATGKEYYAEILETKHEGDTEDWRFGLVGVFISTDDLAAGAKPVVYGAYADGRYAKLDNKKIANQKVNSPSNPVETATINGFRSGTSPFGPLTEAVEGVYPEPTNGSSVTFYVEIFKPIVSDTTYTAAGIGAAAPTSSTADILGYDVETTYAES